jgi:hypothetical protein
MDIPTNDTQHNPYDAFKSKLSDEVAKLTDKGTLHEAADPMRNELIRSQPTSNVFWDTLQKIDDNFDSPYTDTSKPEDLLLLLHYRFGHVSMKRLRRPAERGIFPKKIATCQTPILQSCIYGKMTRRPWRTKPALNIQKRTPVTKPGMVVSVDQLESPVPGFVAQMKGRITRKNIL